MHHVNELYKRFLKGECNREEIEFLLEQFQRESVDDQLLVLIAAQLEKEAPAGPDSPEVEAILERNRRRLMLAAQRRTTPAITGAVTNASTTEVPEIDTPQIGGPGIGDRRRRVRWYAAASLAALLCLGIYIYGPFATKHFSSTTVVSESQQQDAEPGGDRATLTLADGNTIALDESAEGRLAEQGGVELMKNGQGQLEYVGAQPAAATAALVYNTISTPRGGKYRVTLPDGTRVWLNAGSTLRYPVSFSAAERVVELSGEGYFEVAHRDDHPFIVKSHGQEVKVLGTHFNIKAYDDEPYFRTTLVEGQVSIRQLETGQEQILKPGEQARLSDGSFEVSRVAVEESIGWKDGLFVFRNTDIHSVMNQLERWYDVELDAPVLPEKRFYGEMPRDVKLSEILDMMEVTSGLKFKVEGRRIMLD